MLMNSTSIFNAGKGLFGNRIGPDAPFEWNFLNIVALFLSSVCALLANSAGVGGGPFYMPMFNSLLGFDLVSSTALSHTVVATSGIASTCYGMFQRNPIDPDNPLIDFSLALTFVPALLIGTGIGVIFNPQIPNWLQTLGLIFLLSYVIYRTSKKAVATWHKESVQKQKTTEAADDHEREEKEEGLHTPFLANSTSSVSELSFSKVKSFWNLNSLSMEVDEGVAHILHWLEMQGGGYGMWKRCLKSLFPLLKLIGIWLVFLGIKILMTRSKKCSTEYFVLWFCQTLFCICITAVMLVFQIRELTTNFENMDSSMRQILHPASSDYSETEALKKLITAILIMIGAGVSAGLLGIGGALIFNPFLLAMGVHPQVTASTAVLMILFSSSAISLSFYIHGMLNVNYAKVFAPVCFVSSLLGVTIVGRLIKKTGRASIIIIILTILITMGTILTFVLGSFESYEDFVNGDIGFKPFCAS